jgi:ADP-ribose pyrophosphatase YjhB (NUDIX family)
MKRYPNQDRILVAVDCIIFGFDDREVKLLLIRRGLEPGKGKLSLMGGFVKKEESLDAAAARVLKTLTGLEGIYMEQLHAFGDGQRDPVERTISISYFALIDIKKFTAQISARYDAEWYPIDKIPRLNFDHNKIVTVAKMKLQYRASSRPILFELLPPRFTIPQLQMVYESVFERKFDTRNFSRQVLSSGAVRRLASKDKGNSRKGAFLYSLNKAGHFPRLLNFASKKRLRS